MLLPYVGFLKPTDKKSLKSLQEDIEDHVRRKINIETGQIYMTPLEGDQNSENPYQIEDPSEFE